MFASDAATFLADMGEAVTWSSSPATPKPSGLMLFNQPDVDFQSGEIISREYEVVFEVAAWAGLKRGDVLVIGGAGGGSSYKLRTDPHREGDGVFAKALLTKV